MQSEKNVLQAKYLNENIIFCYIYGILLWKYAAQFLLQSFKKHAS